MLKMLVFVAMGGALGAVARYLTIMGVGRVLGSGFPYGTLTVNILGSFILGMLVEAFALKWHVSQEVRAMIVVGVLGAFTTFSSFSLDAILQLARQPGRRGGLYPLLGNLFGAGPVRGPAPCTSGDGMSGVSQKTIGADDADMRLDRWFHREFPHVGHGRLSKLLRTGQVRLDGKRCKVSDRVQPGQVVRLPPLGEAENKPAPRNRVGWTPTAGDLDDLAA